MNKKRIIYIILISTILFTVSCGGNDTGIGAGANEPTDHLSLGERFLLELEYEQALFHFLALIEIEPMNPRGYTGAAQAHIWLGQHDKAIAILQRGLEVLPDSADILNMLHELQGEISEAMLILREIFELFEAGNITTGEELFIANRSVLREASRYEPLRYLPHGATGRGADVFLGMYLHHGYYVDSLRNGLGTNRFFASWGDTRFVRYAYYGNWSDDKPNGAGMLRSDQPYVSYTLEGELRNGLWNGVVYKRIFSHISDTESKERIIFDQGKPGEHFYYWNGAWRAFGGFLNSEFMYEHGMVTMGVLPFADWPGP